MYSILHQLNYEEAEEMAQRMIKNLDSKDDLLDVVWTLRKHPKRVKKFFYRSLSEKLCFIKIFMIDNGYNVDDGDIKTIIASEKVEGYEDCLR